MKNKNNSHKKKNNAKQRIRKSDDIIVVARQSIEQMILETGSAKRIKDAIKRIRNEVIDEKVSKNKTGKRKPGIRNQKPDNLKHDIYLNINQIKEFYKTSKLDYGEIFSYLGNSVFKPEYDYESYNHEKKQDSEEALATSREIRECLDNFMIRAVTGNSAEINIEQKEKMRYYLMINSKEAILKISLSQYKMTDDYDLDRIFA